MALLGARGVDMLAWESFGRIWAADVVDQLKLDDVRVLKADYGLLLELGEVDPDHDEDHLERDDQRRPAPGPTGSPPTAAG